MGEQAHIVEVKLYIENEYDPHSPIPCNSAGVIPLMEERYSNYKWAWCVHDRDTLKNSHDLCKPHIHFSINATGTTLSLDKIRRDFSISYSNVYAKDDWNETVKYLAHRTKSALADPDKFTYDVSDIHSNFDVNPIFSGEVKSEDDEISILQELMHQYFDKDMSLLDLGKYCNDIGAWRFFKKNFNMLVRIIKDEETRRLSGHKGYFLD